MLHLHDAGKLAYRPAWDLQLELHAKVLAATPGFEEGALMLVEHPPVVTIGRRPGAEQHLLVPAKLLALRGVEVVETDRGGDITFHGPGQLVAYPIIPLNRYGLNLHTYMRLLEQVVIDTLAPFGIAAQRDPSPCSATGVWVNTGTASLGHASGGPVSCTSGGEFQTADYAKICALGIKVRRWVTFHGIALNVSTDLSYFQLINPCGLSRPVTSMEHLLGAEETPSMGEIKTQFAFAMNRQLQRVEKHAEAPSA